MENEIFKRSSVNFNLLKEYGFKKIDNNYVFEKEFLNNDFKAIITIDNNGFVNGKVIDEIANEEYINIRTDMTGEFVNKVRESYKNILEDIKNYCFDTNYFISKQANKVNKYIKEKYNDNPEFLWDKFPGFAIYRNAHNNKWYGVIMNIDLSKLGHESGGVEIINVKLNQDKILQLLKRKGFYKAYHMNKRDWISIVLNDTVKDEELFSLLDQSYEIISKLKG